MISKATLNKGVIKILNLSDDLHPELNNINLVKEFVDQLMFKIADDKDNKHRVTDISSEQLCTISTSIESSLKNIDRILKDCALSAKVSTAAA